MSESVVYFIKPIGMDGPIKIGTSLAHEGESCIFVPFTIDELAAEAALELGATI
jgi:hypothetical protein